MATWGEEEGLRRICKELEKECWMETHQEISLDKTILSCHVQEITVSLSQFNEDKRWITAEEYEFPAKGVSQNWVKCFVEKHSDKIKAFWSHPLDRLHACTVNPYTKEEFFKLLEVMIEGDGGDNIIPLKLIHGTDETGIQQRIGVKERVYGPQGAKIQHQQQSGDRENITVITMICADSTWVAPAVIFKGEGMEWIKDFNRQTESKAAKYAHTHAIEVLCYLSHFMHAYQSLDIVIFNVTHQKVTKSNFLEIYSIAHNIKAAFKKTEVIHLNPNLISEEMMVPSLEMSTKSTMLTLQSSPMHHIISMQTVMTGQTYQNPQ
ncbi:hypothetical protein EDD85DRAFT_921551 [Armillaria nabsnona]|nr:hypothetical protein EDD85DRAFT_921551 [Armillaria nabsnona]